MAGSKVASGAPPKNRPWKQPDGTLIGHVLFGTPGDPIAVSESQSSCCDVVLGFQVCAGAAYDAIE